MPIRLPDAATVEVVVKNLDPASVDAELPLPDPAVLLAWADKPYLF